MAASRQLDLSVELFRSSAAERPLLSGPMDTLLQLPMLVLLGAHMFKQAGYRLSYATTETVRPRPRRCRCRCLRYRCLRVTGGSSCGARRRARACSQR